MKRCPVCNCEPRRLLSVSEVAAALGKSDRTIRGWIKRGLLTSSQLNPPRGMHDVHHDSVDALILLRRQEA